MLIDAPMKLPVHELPTAPTGEPSSGSFDRGSKPPAPSLEDGWLLRLRRGVMQEIRSSPENIMVWALGIALCALRFVGLEQSPLGFFSDEFRGALHQICLGEQGVSAYGERWPLFVPGAGGGLYTPPFLYIGMLWLKAWGPSIASCRALAASFTLLATLATTGVAWRIAGANVARWTFLVAAMSPWAFQFARIAWDPPLAPAFLMAALFFWLGQGRAIEIVLSSICFVGALYAYPPMRIHAPLALVLFWWSVDRPRFRFRDLALFGGVGLLLAAPLISGTLDGSLTGRGSAESIFSSAFLANSRGDNPPALFALRAFLDNLHAHFNPTYLFFEGDKNFRHSTQSFGVFGLLDIFALALAVCWLAFVLLRFAAPIESWFPRRWAAAFAKRPSTPTGPRARLLVLASAAYLFGVVPAALCWSGVPHALRSIGCWPFLALLSGVVLTSVRERWGALFSVATLSVAALHIALFVPAYFRDYPKIPGLWFDVPIKETLLAQNPDRAQYAQIIASYPEAFRFYEIAYRGSTCHSSAALLQEALATQAQKPKPRKRGNREQRSR